MSDNKRQPWRTPVITGLLLAAAAVVALSRRSTPPKDSFLSKAEVSSRTAEPSVDKAAGAGKITMPRATDPLVRFQAELGTLPGEKDPLSRERQLEEWVKKASAGDIPSLLALLDSAPESEINQEAGFRLLRKLAAEDPRFAAEIAGAKPAGPVRQRLLNAVGATWAGKSLADAAAWARQLPEEDRNGVLASVAYEAVTADPRTALELARDLPSDDNRTELITHIAGQWATRNPRQIADWAGQFEDDAIRSQLISRIAADWGEKDPAAAAGLALSALPPGRDQDDAVVGIVQRWVQNEPTAAAGWVAAFPEGPLRETAAEELVKLWADKNPSDAGGWLDSLPPGPSRDSAANAYVGKVVNANPESAAQWASQIEGESLRMAAMERVASAWMESDPAKGAEWINRSGLPDETKQRLLKPAKK